MIRYYLIVLLVISMFLSCKHEWNNIVIPSCLDQNNELAIDSQTVITLDSIVLIPTTWYPGKQFKNGTFNPNNNNEIVFIKEWRTYRVNLPTIDTLELWKYDFCKNEAIKLCDQAALGPSWFGDRIVYTDRYGQIWRINADGTNQFRLTSLGYNKFASWSPDGSSFVFNRVYGEQDITMIMNMDGVILDTLENMRNISGLHWTADNKIYFAADSLLNTDFHYAVWYYNLLDHSIQEFAYLSNFKTTDNTIAQLKWLPNTKQLIAVSRLEVSVFTDTGKQIIKTGFDNRWYQFIDISADETIALTSRIERKKDWTNVIHYENLYLMDLMTGEEREILIPIN